MYIIFLLVIVSNAQQLSPCEPVIVANFEWEFCGTNRCVSASFAACSALFEINPSITTSISEQVEIFYNQDKVGVSYSINFIPRDADCISPTLSFSYVDIDNDYGTEWLSVVIDPDTSIQCGTDSQCTLNECFSDVPVPSLSVIPQDTPYTLMVIAGFEIDSTGGECDSIDSPLVDVNATIVANLTINCAVVPTSDDGSSGGSMDSDDQFT